jgi:hypothetical protein
LLLPPSLAHRLLVQYRDSRVAVKGVGALRRSVYLVRAAGADIGRTFSQP